MEKEESNYSVGEKTHDIYEFRVRRLSNTALGITIPVEVVASLVLNEGDTLVVAITDIVRGLCRYQCSECGHSEFLPRDEDNTDCSVCLTASAMEALR